MGPSNKSCSFSSTIENWPIAQSVFMKFFAYYEQNTMFILKNEKNCTIVHCTAYRTENAGTNFRAGTKYRICICTKISIVHVPTKYPFSSRSIVLLIDLKKCTKIVPLKYKCNFIARNSIWKCHHHLKFLHCTVNQKIHQIITSINETTSLLANKEKKIVCSVWSRSNSSYIFGAFNATDFVEMSKQIALHLHFQWNKTLEIEYCQHNL